jgi:outer membrane murein-binding lipoprotein Lpp
MKQAAKATALVLGVSLLSGCSSSEAKACKAATKAYSELSEQSRALGKSIKILEQGSQGFKAIEKGKQQIFIVKQALLVKINNPSCFTPQEVSEAQLVLKEFENLK